MTSERDAPSNAAAESPLVAIIVPTHNAEHHLPRLLRSIQAQSYHAYAVVVVDQESSDRTVEIAELNHCKAIRLDRPPFYSPPGRSRNVGARALGGDVLLHLDADMELPTTDFLADLIRLFDDRHRAVIIHERDIAVGFWSKCKALERSCYEGTGMEAARAVTRELFTLVGGYDEDVASGEDFFITRLYEQHTSLASDASIVVFHHTGAQSLRAMLRKKYSYGRTANIYLAKAPTIGARSAKAIASASLAAYIANWRLLLSHPFEYLGIFPLRAMELIAVWCGMHFKPRLWTGQSSQL